MKLRDGAASAEYRMIRDKIPLEEGKHLDEYEVYTSVQRFYGDKTKYFVADQLFCMKKEKINMLLE